MIKAILTIVIGLLILINPHAMADTLMLIFGLLIGVSGLSLIVGAYNHRVFNSEWTWWLLEGLVDILVCLLVIFKPIEAANFLCIVAGLWMTLMGFIHLASAINLQYYVSGNSVFIITSIFLIVSGLFFLIFPDIGLKLLMTIIGVCIICFGFIQIYISFLLKKVSVEEIGEIEDLY